MDVMLILGDYAFGLNTAAFQELNRNTEWRWPSQDVFERVPALQFTGYGRDTISLPGVIFPEYWGGTGQLDQLRAIANDGKPQTLIDGRGNVLGDYVITGVQERQSVFAGAGVPLRQEFTVTLERYAMGGIVVPVGGQAGAQLSAAVAEPDASTETAGGIAAEADAVATKSAGGLAESLASIEGMVASVTTPLSDVIGAVNRGIGVARSIQTSATVAQQTIKALGRINSLASAQAALNGITLATGSAAQAATAAGRAISDTVATMQAAGESLEAIRAVRGAMVQMNQLAVGATSARAQAEAFVGGFA